MSDTWVLPKQLHTLASALDTEALSLDSNEQSLICAQSLFVRSKPSQLRTWSAKWKRDSWTRHLSGRILRPSLGNRFADAWISSLGVIHASPSVRQENDKERTTLVTSGLTSQEEFRFFNQERASLKTSKDISAWGCPTSSKTWQEWVIERRGAYSQRLNAERHTNASGCSSWRTPNSQLIEAKPHGTKLFGRTPADPQVGLADQVANWPSPVASEVRQGFQDRSRGMKGSQESLTTVVIKGWPTPNAADSLQGGSTQGNRKDPNLSIAVHGPAVPVSSSTPGSRPGLWHTPEAHERTHTSRKCGHGTIPLANQVAWRTPDTSDRRSSKSTQIGLSNQISGKLNPRWVETLMGLPVGWTMPSCASPVTIERMNSDSSATESSPQPPH